MRRLVAVFGLAAFLCAGLLTTTASAALKGGMGDQNASTFSDPNFKALGIKRTRLIVPYDAIFKNPAGVDAWVQAALGNKVEPLIAFNPKQGSRCPNKPCSVPSVKAYTKAFKEWRKRYPKIKLFNFWNETNSATQPTGSTKKTSGIKRAAQLYVAAKRICGRRCTVTGPDILDQNIGDRSRKTRKNGQARMRKWVSLFLKYAGRKNYPKIWGFHNYGDTNYFRTTGTAFFLKHIAKKGQVWVTETGGDYAFKLQSGRVVFKPNAARQAKATRYAYTVAKKFRKRITRLYYYQWRKNNPDDFFDAGIIDFDGNLRPAYTQLEKLPKSFWR